MGALLVAVAVIAAVATATSSPADPAGTRGRYEQSSSSTVEGCPKAAPTLNSPLGATATNVDHRAAVQICSYSADGRLVDEFADPGLSEANRAAGVVAYVDTLTGLFADLAPATGDVCAAVMGPKWLVTLRAEDGRTRRWLVDAGGCATATRLSGAGFTADTHGKRAASGELLSELAHYVDTDHGHDPTTGGATGAGGI